MYTTRTRSLPTGSSTRTAVPPFQSIRPVSLFDTGVTIFAATGRARLPYSAQPTFSPGDEGRASSVRTARLQLTSFATLSLTPSGTHSTQTHISRKVRRRHPLLTVRSVVWTAAPAVGFDFAIRPHYSLRTQPTTTPLLISETGENCTVLYYGTTLAADRPASRLSAFARLLAPIYS